jgi:hypothetical protein
LLLTENVAALKLVQEILRHSSIKQTMRYAHLMPDVSAEKVVRALTRYRVVRNLAVRHACLRKKGRFSNKNSTLRKKVHFWTEIRRQIWLRIRRWKTQFVIRDSTHPVLKTHRSGTLK